MEKKVKVYEVKTWKAGEYFPPNRNTMICLAELTEQKRKHVTAGPITIMCPLVLVNLASFFVIKNKLNHLIFSTRKQIQYKT